MPAVSPGPLSGAGSSAWNVISIAGCAVVSAVWYWYSGRADTAPDYLSCAAIVGLPIARIVFQKKLDALVRPLSSTIGMIPRRVRAGIAVGAPLLVATQLYSAGSTEFFYMFKTTVISTAVSYVMMRVPAARTLRGSDEDLSA